MPVDDIDINRIVFPGIHGGNIKVRNGLIFFSVESFAFHIGVDGIAAAVVGEQFVNVEQRRFVSALHFVARQQRCEHCEVRHLYGVRVTNKRVQRLRHRQDGQEVSSDNSPFVKGNINRIPETLHNPHRVNFSRRYPDFFFKIHRALSHIRIIVGRVFPIAMNGYIGD